MGFGSEHGGFGFRDGLVSSLFIVAAAAEGTMQFLRDLTCSHLYCLHRLHMAIGEIEHFSHCLMLINRGCIMIVLVKFEASVIGPSESSFSASYRRVDARTAALS